MHISRKTRESAEVSTASMPDIIFMLLIFFMVTTVMREFEGLDVLVPKAKMIEKLESKRNTAYVWASNNGSVMVDDHLVNMKDLRFIISSKMQKRPKTTISLRADQNASMETITSIHTELRNAYALKLSYSAKTQE
ncbi:MAG: biopolymer transporter ExbD [Candidatus Marinimicrobia bacterium]|jgi:biopolymer transport protein ExbD|nr:biopolymer transporter ExbD [Candidatus Neomarinimicrobiota bacterium]MBT3632948.1 biopolymer transporter ExbD [Candidatus Neomarinimicrobiota bacterium]MBT3682058.1 biopolymer transporter ExbD [Candidatus Neomarinimicrobiota bacterium]MBT3758913.1 biopolymer transporter ExbD [Candidatus Neomarinimicrobiota bacterium]MBT3895188.1 biopolymer transporter ExbD [Candidatus Neomarinimicrobiota bacterium]